MKPVNKINDTNHFIISQLIILLDKTLHFTYSLINNHTDAHAMGSATWDHDYVM